MADRNINEITISEAEQGECSDPTVEIKIKTLDSQTYTLRVNKCVPVPALKEQIATVTGVLSEQQRLICRGKVLKDDQLLSAYHVEDGHTLHLVVRQPLQQPPSSVTGNGGSDGRAEPPGSDPTSGASRNRSGHVSSSVLLGTFNVGDQGEGSIPDLNRIVSSLLNTVGIGNVVPVSAGIASGSTISQGGGIEVHERATDANGRSDANPMQSDHVSDVHVDPVHGAFRFAPAFLPRPFNQPTVIPDSLTTLSQYMNRMRHEFALHGPENQSQPTSQSSEAEALGSSSDRPSVSEGLPTPAALGTVIRHTQQLLTNQAGSSLSQLARQLESEATVSDPVARDEIQIAAMQSGIMMQNLGALLLELGRTTMTLRMGQSSAGSVVNAGPAVFISTTGPNPLMVQALPFQPASSFGAIPVGATHPAAASIGGTVGTGDVLRNIDIHIRTGSSVASASSSEQGERGSVQQVEGQGNQVGSAQGGVFGRHGVSSVVGESGAVRVVPVRTVVAVPASINGRSSNESSGSSVGVFYPLLARFQQLNPLQLTQMRGVPQTHLSGIHSRSADTPQQHPLPSESLPTIRAHVQVQASMPTAGQNARSQEEVEQANSSANAGLMQSQAGSVTEQGIPQQPQQGQSSMHVYSIHLGTRNTQGDHEQSNGGRSVSEGSSLAQLPTGLGQIISGMVSEGSSGTARGETVDIMSQILHNAPRSDITGPAVVHIGSHAGLTNVIEQAMQNPFSSSGLHVTGQRGVRSQNLSEMNSGSHGNHGMVDLSGVLQHLMPSVSQVLRRESEASAQHQGAEAGRRASASEGPSSSSNGEAHPQMSTSSEGQCAAERNGAEVRKARSDIDSGNVNGDFEHDAERQQPDHSDDSYPGGSPASKRQRTQ